MKYLLMVHFACDLNDGAATLLNPKTSGMRDPPSLADKLEITAGEDLVSGHLPITIELRYQASCSKGPLKERVA